MSSTSVCLVATVLNERQTIDHLLESIIAQTRAPDEIVIVDGGSSDGTWERLLGWVDRLPLRPLRAPGANISEGRNRAIRESSAEWIAVTDAGVRLQCQWLERLLGAADGADVVSGFFAPDGEGPFELAMGATVLPERSDVSSEDFLPSSRSLLVRRTAWERSGGYPEWLDYGEDLVFDLALKADGCRFAFMPDAIVSFRPRGSLVSFFRQYFVYARGDGKADLWRKRHAVRYVAYWAATWLLGRHGRSARAWLLLALGAAAYTRRPYQRLAPRLRQLTAGERIYALLLVPIIRLVGDLAKMLGYPPGVWWRLKRAWRWA